MKTKFIVLSLGLSLAADTLLAFAAEKPAITHEGEMNVEGAAKAFPKPIFSPYANRNYPTRLLWGDEPVHTGRPVDGEACDCTLGPVDAVPFTRGEQIKSSLRKPAKLSRLLDWVAVADPSDATGVVFEIRDGNPQKLWKWMEKGEAKTSGSLLAIPHNGNLSKGKIWALTTLLGNPLNLWNFWGV
jgi:hypothetical protein